MAAPEVAVLYVDGRGVYSGLGVDCWDRDRDARLYNGPLPVVAHPPCQRWGMMAAAAFGRWGHEHLRPGNDGGCFEAALESVRRWGGVLEHPAGSWAWAAYGLRRPTGIGWGGGPGEWTCEVWQSAYGHRARKKTWLFASSRERPLDLLWDRRPGTHQVGHRDRRGKGRNLPTLSSTEAAATPVAFALALIEIARRSR